MTPFLPIARGHRVRTSATLRRDHREVTTALGTRYELTDVRSSAMSGVARRVANVALGFLVRYHRSDLRRRFARSLKR